jgi:hypothetical protein
VEFQALVALGDLMSVRLQASIGALERKLRPRAVAVRAALDA